MYNPDACLDIIEKASPVSVSRIRSYATLFTCYIWARYQSTRALDRMCACTETGADVSSSKIRDSSLPATIKQDLCYLAIVAVIIAVTITIYNIL